MARQSNATKAKSQAKAKAKARSAAALAALSSDAPLFDQQEAAEGQAKQKGSRKRQRSADEIVAKCIRDNFAMFKGSQSTMLLNRSGMSLFEVLKRDILLAEEGDASAPVRGKLYYQKLREEFAYSDSPAKRLKVTAEDEPIDEDLMKGLTELNRHPRSYEGSLAFLDSNPLCNQRSLVLLYRQALLFNPSGGVDAVNFLMALLKYICRTNAHEHFQDEWLIVRSHLDEACCKALSFWKGAQMTAKLWWELNRDHLSLLLPEADTDACMAVTGDYQKVEVALCRVVQSSKLGNLLFGSAHRQYQGGKISNLIQAKMVELVSQNITEVRVAQLRAAFVRQASDKGKDVKETQAKRTVELMYRGCRFSMAVHSHMDEYLMAEAACIESVAVETRALGSLFCEDELVPASRPSYTITIETKVLASAEKARLAARSALIAEKPSGEVILNCLTTNLGQFVQLHRAFRCTVSFWQSVVGEGSEKRLKQEVLKALGDDANRVSLEEAIQRLDMLQSSKLVAFCGLGLQSLFSSCVQFIADIKANRQPRYDGSSDSDFLKSIMRRVGEFYSVVLPARGTEAARTMYGRAAVDAKLAEIRGKRTANTTVELSDISLLKVYGWLLKDEEKAEVDTWANECMQADVVAAADYAAASTGKPTRGKPGRKRVAPSARDAVLKLLS